MANERREQRKKERAVRRLRKADERAGILSAMDANRASLSNAPTEDVSSPSSEKSGTITVSQEPKGRMFVSAENQPNRTAAKEAEESQTKMLKQKGFTTNFPGGLNQEAGKETWESYNFLNAPVTTDNTNNANIPTSGSTLVSAVSKGDGTIGELNSALNDAKTANDQELQLKNIASTITNESIKDLNDLPDKQQDEVLPGDGRTLAGSDFMQVERGARPSFAQTDTKDDIRSKILEKNREMLGDAPKVALEQLSAEDYYPNIRKDIAVGTYQGRYLGSATIFAAPGARAPLGLYDARQRALKEAAQTKQKQIEDILSVPETSPQYQALYNEAFYNMLESNLERLDYDFDAFSTDIQAMRDMSRFKAKAKEITESVAFADAILKAGADDATYTPQEMIDISKKIKYAQVNDLDAILAGDKNAVEPLKKAQIYKDLVPEVQELAKDLLNPERMGQSPINLRTGGKYDSEQWINERNQFFDKVATGIGWDEYATGIVKYFGGDYELMIDNLVKGRGGSEDQVEPMKKMFASMIQNQTILSYKTVNNDEVALMNLRERQRQFNINREDRMNNFWGNVNNAVTNFVDPKTGKTYEQELKEAQNIKDPKKRELKLKQIAEYYNPGREVYVDDRTGAFSFFLPPSPEQSSKDAEPKPTVSSSGKPLMYVPVQVKGSDGKWANRYYTLEQVAGTKSTIKIGNKILSQKDKDDYRELKGTVYTKVIGTETQKAYTNKNGQLIYLKADGSNLAEYNAAEKKHTVTKQIEKPYLRKKTFDAVTKTDTFMNVELVGTVVTTNYDINNKVDQQVMNNQSGYKPQAAAQETFDSGDTYNYSGSSSSGGQ